jgi:hypothetical protein
MTECQIIPSPRPSEALVVQPDGRWTNGVDNLFCAKPGPCPCEAPCEWAEAKFGRPRSDLVLPLLAKKAPKAEPSDLLFRIRIVTALLISRGGPLLRRPSDDQPATWKPPRRKLTPTD